VKDVLEELLATKKKVEGALKNSKLYELEEFSDQNEFEKFKNVVVNMIVPENYYENVDNDGKI
jgi:hypothetical protein